MVASVGRLVGLPTPHVAPGSDLTALVLTRHVAANERITIVGLSANSLPRWSRAAVWRLRHTMSPRGFERDPAALRMTVEFVLSPCAFHFPRGGISRQEILATAIQATGRATGIGLCIGATWSSSLVRNRAHRPGCSIPVWNGCTGSAAIQAVWHVVI